MSLDIKIDSGIIDMSIIVKAGAAACAKNASDEAAHTCVANVLNPIGPSIKVAGSSLTVNKNTNDAAIKSPGFINGMVIFLRTFG